MQDVRVCRVAFVGAGGMFAENARAFEGLPGVEFAAIYKRSRNKAVAISERRGFGPVFDDLLRSTRRVVPHFRDRGSLGS